MNCKKCGEQFEPAKGLLRFCSLSCRNSRQHSDETKKKTSETVKQKIEEGIFKMPPNRKGTSSLTLRKRVNWKCPVCDTIIELVASTAAKRKFCSGTCRNKVNNQLITGQRSKAEIYLAEKLIETFPNLEILFNTRQVLSNNKELDVYFPSLNLAIEWNGIWHFINARKGLAENDLKKIEECKEKGIELLIVEDRTSHKKFIVSETEKIIENLKYRLA